MSTTTYTVGDIVEIARTDVKWSGANRTVKNTWAIGQVAKVWPYGFGGELHCEVKGATGGNPMLSIINCNSRGIRHMGENTAHPEENANGN